MGNQREAFLLRLPALREQRKGLELALQEHAFKVVDTDMVTAESAADHSEAGAVAVVHAATNAALAHGIVAALTRSIALVAAEINWIEGFLAEPKENTHG